MRTKAFFTGAIIISILHFPACTTGQTQMSMYGTDRGINSFYLSVGEYYGLPERDIIIIRDRRIPDEEIPVVCFIARGARVEPRIILDMRSRGQSWMDISLHFGLNPDIYYVPVTEVYGTSYNRVYGYYKNRPRKEWNRIRLSDNDIVNIVNLRFVSEHYGYEAPRVMRLRGEGKSFVKINEEARSWKHEKAKDSKGRGNAKGKKKNKG